MQTMERVRHYRRINTKHANYPFSVRAALAFLRLVKAPVMLVASELKVKVFRADGTVEDYGIASRRLVTTVGVNFIVDCHQNLAELENLNYHAMGTGAAAEAIGDTAMTQVESRVAGTQSEPAANQYRTVATITATAARAVTEHGIWSASTAGTLFDRSVFAAINLGNGDSIQFTYTLSYTAGG
jgi:hypothetical protein